MSTPDELRGKLTTIRGLSNERQADREVQELLAEVFIEILDAVSGPTIHAITDGTITREEADAIAAELSSTQVHQQPTEPDTVEQMMDAVRPTEAGQTVTVEGGNGVMGEVLGFGVSEGREWADVDWPQGRVRTWVDTLLVVTLEPDHGAGADQFDFEVGDDDAGTGQLRPSDPAEAAAFDKSVASYVEESRAERLGIKPKKAKKKGKGL